MNYPFFLLLEILAQEINSNSFVQTGGAPELLVEVNRSLKAHPLAQVQL